MDKIFARGAFLKKPREGAPEYVMGSLGIKVDDFKKFLDEHVKVNGFVDLDLMIGREDKPYVALNQYKPEKPEVAKDAIPYPTEEINPNDVPF